MGTECHLFHASRVQAVTLWRCIYLAHRGLLLAHRLREEHVIRFCMVAFELFPIHKG